MKMSKFSDSQIAFILRQAEEGIPVGGLSQSGYLRSDLLPLAQEVWGPDVIRDEAPQAA